MTREVEVRGRRRTIEVRGTGPDWELRLDGRILGVNVTAKGERWSLLIGPPEHDLDGPAEAGPHDRNVGAGFSRPLRSYEVAIDRRSNGERIVHVNGRAVLVSIVDPRVHLAARRGASAPGTGPRSVVSPMPGRIVKVLVKAGDTVAAHQGLIVVEAMKMENELRAPRAGRVTSLHVVDGMSVEANALLVTLE